MESISSVFSGALTRGGSRILKGGAQSCYCEHIVIVCEVHNLCVQSMPNLGGLGACLPEIFEKLNPLRSVEFEGIFNGLLIVSTTPRQHIAQ